MRVRVKQGQSVCHGGIWFNQGDEFGCSDASPYKDQVEVLPETKKPEAPKPSKKSEEE